MTVGGFPRGSTCGGTDSRLEGHDSAVGIVVEDFTVPYFGQVVTQVERGAHERGLDVVITCAGADRSVEDAVASLLSRNVAGFVVATGSARASAQAYLADVASHRPVVQVDAPAASSSCDTVGIDNADAGRQLTEHLISRGHRQILFVGSGPSAITVEQRRHGYETAMLRAGLVPRSVHLGYLPWHTTERAVTALELHTHVVTSGGGITAVLSGVARVTTGLASAIAILDRRDLAFAAIDDVDGADAFFPPLTVLEQDVETIGARAAQLLLARLDGWDGPVVHEQVPVRLIERGSGELLPPAWRSPRADSTARGRPSR